MPTSLLFVEQCSTWNHSNDSTTEMLDKATVLLNNRLETAYARKALCYWHKPSEMLSSLVIASGDPKWRSTLWIPQ